MHKLINTHSLVIIKTTGTNENLGYLHLNPANFNRNEIQEGKPIKQGQSLGYLRPYKFDNPNTLRCGRRSTVEHLHLYLPTRPFRFEEVTFGNPPPYGPFYSTQHGGTVPDNPIPTPTLHDNAQFPDVNFPESLTSRPPVA